ncbi:hypothetical protein TNCV_4840821 [Trichonephila clavipes]|nr:hypothetical protein TNCV_4840821 [Trichonephila clavipes]
MENNICNSMILTSRRRHFYLVLQSKHKVGACGVNNQASAVLAGNELPFVAFNRWIPRGVSFLRPRHRLIAVASLGRPPRNRSIRVWFTRYPRTAFVRALVPQKFSVEEELMHVKHVEVKSPHVGVMWKFGRGVISSSIILVT